MPPSTSNLQNSVRFGDTSQNGFSRNTPGYIYCNMIGGEQYLGAVLSVTKSGTINLIGKGKKNVSTFS